jgi:hypothetical protein
MLTLFLYANAGASGRVLAPELQELGIPNHVYFAFSVPHAVGLLGQLLGQMPAFVIQAKSI